jgi:YHS domain-containing protein
MERARTDLAPRTFGIEEAQVMKIRQLALAALAAAVVTTGATLAAQKAAEPAIGGYCPVAYQAANMAQKGDPKVTSTFDGQTFYLTNQMVKDMFDKAPEKYAPAYHGYCAAAVAKGMKVKANPELFSVVDGKTYLFSTREAKAMFDKDKANTIAMANQAWPKVSKVAVAQ